jgi:hypothetical protein
LNHRLHAAFFSAKAAMAKSWFVCKFIQKRAEAPRTFESLELISWRISQVFELRGSA